MLLIKSSILNSKIKVKTLYTGRKGIAKAVAGSHVAVINVCYSVCKQRSSFCISEHHKSVLHNV